MKPYELTDESYDCLVGEDVGDIWRLAQKKLLEYLDNKYHQHLPKQFVQPMYVPAEEWDTLLRDFGIS